MDVDRWDLWNAHGGPSYPHAKVIQFCLRNYSRESRPETEVLDLGCGSGVHTAFLAAEGFRVTGVDISPVAIENTRRRLAVSQRSARLLVRSADCVDFAPTSFDLVIAVGLFDSTGPEVFARALVGIRDTLKGGGRGFFVFAARSDFRLRDGNSLGLYGYRRAEVKDLLGSGWAESWIDSYVTTYENCRRVQHDWIVTVRR